MAFVGALSHMPMFLQRRSDNLFILFEILDWSGSRPGPNSEQIHKIDPEWARGMKQNLGNPYEMEDNKAPPSAPPQGGRRFAPPPWVLLSAIR